MKIKFYPNLHNIYFHYLSSDKDMVYYTDILKVLQGSVTLYL